MRKISAALSVIATVSLWISGIGLVLMTAITAWQVFGRYVLNDSPSWSEPTSVILMGWFIFLGAAVGVREGYHLGFDILLVSLSETPRKVFMTISDLMVIFFGLGMGWYGWSLAAGTWNDPLPAIGLPTGISYTPLMLGGLMMAIFSMERIALRFSAAAPLVEDEVQQLDTVA
ncbi:TRAP transporter small permease [Consotaella salsifontis]|uniref:TRAP transporter small permease protein n=1 Tax=Consotaella salsifontis TaxID=1365950 RepID=A0A1T4MIK9_9HYPH|nr:TRAP transporter small permease [Consotaella salsifontis]SJZ66930.1 TRAP-type C4-dicarboxylate transport system, small permease component [Consotaella salsifontis]